MARFELQPCKVRGTRIVPTQDEMLVIESLPDLIGRFCKNPSPRDRTLIQAIKKDAFVGVTKGSVTGKETMFVLFNHNRASNEFGWLTRGNKQALDNLMEIFRVVDVQWDSSFSEVQVGGSAA